MGDIKMPKYKPIRIKLNEREDAEVYYQKVCGKNKTVRRDARILYYAGQGIASMKELCQKAECDYGTVRLLLGKIWNHNHSSPGQKHFLNCTLADLLKDAKNGLKKVYFADGVHLTYGYQKGKCWSKETVYIQSGYGRKRVNVLVFLMQ